MLALAMLAALFLFGTDAYRQTGDESLVRRVKVPELARAPEAVSGTRKEESRGAGDGKAGREQAQDGNGETVAKDIPEPASTELYLTVPKMGLHGDYIVNDASPETLAQGAGKLPESGFPWQPNANTYIASHVLGYSGTGSYMHFAALPNMTYGDKIYLTDANGTTYAYEVTEILTVSPDDVWVTAPVPGKDMISLQTCINPPAYDLRLVVRGERVDVDIA